MSSMENPRAVVGDNQGQSAAERVTEYLKRDYDSLVSEITVLLDLARDQPKAVENDEDAVAMGLVIKEIRDADRRAEAYRETEKAPHRLSADAVDAFFFALREKLARRNPRDHKQRPGAADVLQARINDYLDRKRLAEEERRRQEAAAAAEAARIAQAEADRKAREAEEARLAAERARKPENVVAKGAVADVAERAASDARIEAEIAQQSAEDTHIATLAKPADMSRTRGDGVLLTQAREPYALVVDRTKLDWSKLAPFFTDAEVEKALRQWARVTGHGQKMDGAEIGFGRKGVVR